MERVLSKLKSEEKKHRHPEDWCTHKPNMDELQEMAVFKNDLMQLVVNCKMADIRSRVSSNLTTSLGLEIVLWLSRDKEHYQLL